MMQPIDTASNMALAETKVKPLERAVGQTRLDRKLSLRAMAW